MITFSEKKSWSCSSCGSGYAGVAIPLPCWNGVPPPTNVDRIMRTIRSEMDFIHTSKAVHFAGDRTCMHNQWNASYTWTDGNFSFSKYTLLPFDSRTWMESQQPGAIFEVPKGPYSYTPSQRNTTKCYADVHGSFYLTPNGLAVIEPLTETSFDQYQCWNRGYAQRDLYMYTWSIASSHALCLVTHYTLVIGRNTDNVSAGQAQWGVYCYGNMDSNGNAIYVFDGVSKFGAGGLWVPASSLPRTVTKEDVIGWITNRNSDPFSILGKAVACANQVRSTGVTGFTCSYVSSSPDYSQCSKSILLAGHAADYDRSYVMRPVSENEWADLADTALDNCRFLDINSIAYFKEAISYIRSILTFLTTKKISMPTDVGSSWLSARYGLRLTYEDTKSIIEGGKRALHSDLRDFSVSRAKSVSHFTASCRNVLDYKREATYKVYYNRKGDPALNAIRTAMDWDFWPTLANTWDLIPYSFVIDWFVDVQDVLDKLDNAVYEAYLSILSVLYTEKHTYVHDPKFFSSGSWRCDSCEHIYYHRRQSPFLHYAPLRLERGHLANINIIDGASLVMQRMTK